MKTRSEKKNIAVLARLMLSHGIKHIVVCPGSRNAPIVHTFGEIDGFVCHPVTDERSAAFIAIGLADKIGAPVAVCCTSGSAVLNMCPAVAEAAYRSVPLLVISADRPKEWIGQMDGQTLEQNNVFGGHAKTFEIDNIYDETTHWAVNRDINDALLRLENGPTHINIHLNEPLFGFTEKPLDEERIVRWERGEKLTEEAVAEIRKARRPLIIAGQMRPNDTLRGIASMMAKKYAVIAEHLSNIPTEDTIWRFDEILIENADNEELKPDFVLYIGGHIVSKRIKHFLRKNNPTTCWHISDGEDIIDLFQCVTRMVKSRCLTEIEETGFDDASSYRDAWHKLQTAIAPKPTNDFIDQQIIGNIISLMPEKSILALANSSAVRHAQHYALPNGTEVFCNRGVNGIEGSLSQAVGCALATDKPVVCIIGDLSFFYDMNALWNIALPSNLRIAVVNNGGGAIFNTLPGLEKSTHLKPYVAAQHCMMAENWARACGCQYAKFADADYDAQSVGKLFAKSDSPILLEFMTSEKR